MSKNKLNIENQTIKALSIAQPWAECIVSKGKNVENRSWNTRFRGFFAIHASAGLDLSRFDACEERYNIALDPDKLSYGAIIGFAELVDVITEEQLTAKTKKWFMGECGLILKNIICLKKPVKAKGALSFWSVKGAAKKAILAQLTATQKKAVLSNLLAPAPKASNALTLKRPKKKYECIGGLKVQVFDNLDEILGSRKKKSNKRTA